MNLLPTQLIQKKIYLIRKQKVMLDVDLAELYEVSTKRLNEQVKRNLKRFPCEFMFRLSENESIRLMRSQFATASKRNLRYRPNVFTEHGAIMLASVLNSETAIRASVAIVKAFFELRDLLASHKELREKLMQLEKKYDSQFKVVFDAIRELMEKPGEALEVKGFR